MIVACVEYVQHYRYIPIEGKFRLDGAENWLFDSSLGPIKSECFNFYLPWRFLPADDVVFLDWD